jgi:hypothetical protein
MFQSGCSAWWDHLKLKDSTFIAELNFFFEKIRFYHGAMGRAKEEITAVLKDIEEELK